MLPTRDSLQIYKDTQTERRGKKVVYSSENKTEISLHIFEWETLESKFNSNIEKWEYSRLVGRSSSSSAWWEASWKSLRNCVFWLSSLPSYMPQRNEHIGLLGNLYQDIQDRTVCDSQNWMQSRCLLPKYRLIYAWFTYATWILSRKCQLYLRFLRKVFVYSSPLTFVRVTLFTLEKTVYRDKLLCTVVDWFL